MQMVTILSCKILREQEAFISIIHTFNFKKLSRSSHFTLGVCEVAKSGQNGRNKESEGCCEFWRGCERGRARDEG